uniref:F-actin monooxygenase n=1 Tax=Gadus morhua TaxID=8049 RepID=A0A8C5BAK9_GADMO
NKIVIRSHTLFDNFVQASTCKGTLKAFQELCDHLELQPTDSRVFYHKLKSKLNYWKAKALWAKLDKRAGQKEYKKGRACANSKCLIIGAGPCGLRTAIELGFLGAKVVLLEKRDIFSRNNVLHLWPFTIQDLRGLGAKKFYGKFCAGAIDHISIRQLQLMLLKVALLVGIEIHVNVEFKGLIEPPEDQESEKIGWRAEINPRTHPVNELEFDVIIGADGRRNTLAGFARKEFRGKLAIAITANFINRHTTAEASVEEISGVAFIFNQKFFQDLREATGVDLENIVYYKDDTHYFVMTAKKQSLLEKGVILHDYADTEMLLSRANVDQAALLSYACEAADFSTNRQLPALDFAINHYGLPDVAMFDFTCMYASENAALVRQRHGHKLLVALVGDSLLEPFWPMGTGIARGFLAGIDSAWMVRSWAQGNSPLEVLAERESIYRLLPQTTPENVSKNFSHYSVDPTTRYPNVSLNFLRPNQVRHLIDNGESREMRIEIENVINSASSKLTRNESIARSSKLLNWCQRQTEGYKNVNVTDLTTSWKSGLALCALIHRYRPDLMEYDSLDERNQERNNQLAFDVAEREFGISPCMTGKEMTSVAEPDKLSMVMYISQFYEMFKDTVPPGDNPNLSPEDKTALIASTKSPISFLSKLGQSIAISRKRNPKDKKEKETDGLGKRRKTIQAGNSEDEDQVRTGPDDRPSPSTTLTDRRVDPSAAAGGRDNKVKVMANQLLAKFEENAPEKSTGLKRQVCRGITDHGGRFSALSLPSAQMGFCLTHAFGGMVQTRFTRLSRRLENCSKEGIKPSHFFVEQWYLSRGLRPSVSPLSSPDSPRKRYVKMYTGGVSLLADQIANQLQSHEEPKPLLDKRELGSLRKEFPVNIGGSDVCFFCSKRVYVMERLSAEGRFFHRSCFKCDYCGTTLRLSSYAFDVEDGKFYCKPHYCYRSSGQGQRKRPAPSPALPRPKTPLSCVPTASTSSAASASTPCSSFPEANGLPEPVLPKRLRGTPERIELENYQLSLQREEVLEEVPEETLAEHNLSSVLDKTLNEEVLQQQQQQEEEEQSLPKSPSDLGGVPWREAVELHAKLKGDSEEGGEGGEGADAEDEYEEDEEEEEDDEEESSDGRFISVPPSPRSSVESPSSPFSPAPFVPETALPESAPPSPLPRSPRGCSPSPAVSPGPTPGPTPGLTPALSPALTPALTPAPSPGLPASPAVSPAPSPTTFAFTPPIRSQPVPLPASSGASVSPVYPDRSICPLTGNPLSPICAPSLPCREASSPKASRSPVRTQPVPALSSTPRPNAADPEQSPDAPSEDTPSKKADIIEEFWLKSAEIRKSLGLTPLDRSSRILEKSPDTSSSSSSLAPSPPAPSASTTTTPKPLRPPSLSAEPKRPVIRRLNITLEGQVITPIAAPPSSAGALEGNGSDKKALSSSGAVGSGPGLQRSVAPRSRAAHSESSNASDSTMMTPPSSPPPPVPANQSPAVLRPQRAKTPVSPQRAKTPVPTPRTPRREEARKSFVETVAEIPFADDVDENFDERTPETSLNKYYTPPTSLRPPLHLALAMENGKPNIPGHPRATQFSPEAKEIAEERMRAREKSIKSQALKDAMSKQLTKMKESDAVKSAASKVAWTVAAADNGGKGRKPAVSPNTSAVKALESKKAETLPERFFGGNKSLDGSVASSEGSSGGKSKKRSSLFSPRKSKKEKKAKNEGGRPSGDGETPPKHKSLWKAVFSGYKKDKKKRQQSEEKSCPSTPSSSSTTQDSGKKELKSRRNLSFSEESDLSCDDVLERSSQKSRADKTYTEEELNAKLTRRVQKAARRQAKQEELKRLHRAQIIQRQLEQVEEKQRQLEERGVAVEKALRGEAVESSPVRTYRRRTLSLCSCWSPEGMGKKDDPKLMQEWFKLVQEKNALVRYESELMIFARELELEDRQSRLQQDLRERMAVEDHLKTEQELSREKQILNEMLEVVEQRDSLVALLEEQRLREKEEDKDLESVMLSKGFNLNWV